jgi:hypothetical protein
MMAFISELVSSAEQDNQQMGQLAQSEQKNETKQEALAQLELLLQTHSADGYIDKASIDELLKDFKAQGLDTTTLQHLASELKNGDKVPISANEVNSIYMELEWAKRGTTDPLFNFKASQLMTDFNQKYETASTTSKVENDTYMTAIRNMVA